jgi:hypothetical protein
LDQSRWDYFGELAFKVFPPHRPLSEEGNRIHFIILLASCPRASHAALVDLARRLAPENPTSALEVLIKQPETSRAPLVELALKLLPQAHPAFDDYDKFTMRPWRRAKAFERLAALEEQTRLARVEKAIHLVPDAKDEEQRLGFLEYSSLEKLIAQRNAEHFSSASDDAP